MEQRINLQHIYVVHDGKKDCIHQKLNQDLIHVQIQNCYGFLQNSKYDLCLKVKWSIKSPRCLKVDKAFFVHL